jgi:hypothetical protein
MQIDCDEIMPVTPSLNKSLHAAIIDKDGKLPNR